MPRGDRTGPFGEGPIAGRLMGYCGRYESPGFDSIQKNRKASGRGFGRGPGGGLGRGFGPVFRHGYGRIYEKNPDVSEKTMIENEIRILKDQRSSFEDRLSKLGEG